MALSAEVAICDIYRAVHVRLVLAHPASLVRTRERRLLRTIPHFTARVALLRRVTRIHRLDGDPLLDGLVAYLRVEFGEPPSVETPVHELAVVHRLPDVRQVFQNQHGVLDGFGVLHDITGDTMEHVVYLVSQVVAEGVLEEVTGKGRNKEYRASEIFGILEQPPQTY